MLKEILLIVTFLVCIIIYYICFKDLNKLIITNRKRSLLFITILLVPIIGYILLQSIKNTTQKNN